MSINSGSSFEIYEESMEATFEHAADIDTAHFEFEELEPEEPISLLFTPVDIPQIRQYLPPPQPAVGRPSGIAPSNVPQTSVVTDYDGDVQHTTLSASDCSSVPSPHSPVPRDPPIANSSFPQPTLSAVAIAADAPVATSPAVCAHSTSVATSLVHQLPEILGSSQPMQSSSLASPTPLSAPATYVAGLSPSPGVMHPSLSAFRLKTSFIPSVFPRRLEEQSSVFSQARLPIPDVTADKKGKKRAVDSEVAAHKGTTSSFSVTDTSARRSSDPLLTGAVSKTVKQEIMADEPSNISSRSLSTLATSAATLTVSRNRRICPKLEASNSVEQLNDGLTDAVKNIASASRSKISVQAATSESQKRGNFTADFRGSKRQKITQRGKPRPVNEGARPIRVSRCNVGESEKAYRCQIGDCTGTMLDTEPSCNAHMMALPHFPIQILPTHPPQTKTYSKKDRVACGWRMQQDGRIEVCPKELTLSELGRHVQGHFTETAWRCPLVACTRLYPRKDSAMSHIRSAHKDVDWDMVGEDEILR